MKQLSSSSGSTEHNDATHGAPTFTEIQDSLFSPVFNSRWAASDSVQEPDCVSLKDHDLGSAPIDNVRIIDDLMEGGNLDQAQDRAEEERWLKMQSLANSNDDQGGLFEFSEDEVQSEEVHDRPQTEAVKATLQARHLSRRDRGKQQHHHHQKQQQHHHHNNEKRSAADLDGQSSIKSEKKPEVQIRSDDATGQAVYAVNKNDVAPGQSDASGGVLVHESVAHAETDKGSDPKPADDQQRVLAQAGSQSSEAGSGQLGDKGASMTANGDIQDEAAHPGKGTVLLAAIPILLVMGAIAGFTAYRRYYENSFNRGGRNDTRDDIPEDYYHRRGSSNRKGSGSPVPFERNLMNMTHSPPPTATYFHDHENSSRHQSPSSVASAANMRRPPPSAGSHGKTRFQELSRSYDFGAGLRTIKNALRRSNNNSRESALDQASSGSGSSNSLHGKNTNQAFGAGGHSIAKIGSHTGFTALERQQLQQQYSNGGAVAAGSGSSSGSASKFPDMKNLAIPQEHSIIWGQYSATDDQGYHQDAASAIASNLARRSASSSSLSGGKYSHRHHQQSSSHQKDIDSDSIGDCLSPESPNMTREEIMRRRDLIAEGYTFGSEELGGDDVHSGTDLLFDAHDHFFDLGIEKDAALKDEEMDMYLSMEKEESPFVIDDYNTMNPSPYESKVLDRYTDEQSAIQKSASVDNAADMDEKKALQAEDQQSAAVVPMEKEDDMPTELEETHVLGGDSPEWSSGSETREREGLVEQVLAKDAFGQVRTALGSLHHGVKFMGPIASGIVAGDPQEWEEEPHSSAAASSTEARNAGQGVGQGKKKGNKKAKKGRRH
ncbi:hypothetical protein BGX28_009252 [Mortierella sp. GBA30]|nr:hypothetical protein BGX28_009252 [Mortierella sp. GBA30]